MHITRIIAQSRYKFKIATKMNLSVLLYNTNCDFLCYKGSGLCVCRLGVPLKDVALLHFSIVSEQVEAPAKFIV